jgi:hypothetical protein
MWTPVFPASASVRPVASTAPRNTSSAASPTVSVRRWRPARHPRLDHHLRRHRHRLDGQGDQQRWPRRRPPGERERHQPPTASPTRSSTPWASLPSSRSTGSVTPGRRVVAGGQRRQSGPAALPVVAVLVAVAVNSSPFALIRRRPKSSERAGRRHIADVGERPETRS